MISLKEPEGFGKALRDLLLKIQNESVVSQCFSEERELLRFKF